MVPIPVPDAVPGTVGELPELPPVTGDVRDGARPDDFMLNRHPAIRASPMIRQSAAEYFGQYFAKYFGPIDILNLFGSTDSLR